MAPIRVLIVDDAVVVRRMLSDVLAEDPGLEIAGIAANGRIALAKLSHVNPEVVILDVEMPEMDGWQVLERVREISDVPVLMLTAKGSESDKVRGLAGGADDYVAKPFGPRELIARVEALLRRTGGAGGVLSSADGMLILDEEQHRVLVSATPLDLTPTEFRLLAMLLRNQRQVVTQDQLLEELWGGKADPKQLRLYVSYLRRKFEPFGIDPVETVRGVGYRLRTSR